jgi:protein-tyrosine phosphatase
VATAAGELTVRPAQLSDLDAVTALYEESAAWIRAQGFEPGEPPRPLREIVTPRIDAGSVYIAMLNSAILATITLLWEDVATWGVRPDDAIYVHGFSVKRAYAGQEIGRRLLQWVEAMAARAGRPCVRLDCMASNPRLRAYYERAGFQYCGDVALASYIGSRYERCIAQAPTGEQA